MWLAAAPLQPPDLVETLRREVCLFAQSPQCFCRRWARTWCALCGGFVMHWFETHLQRERPVGIIVRCLTLLLFDCRKWAATR